MRRFDASRPRGFAPVPALPDAEVAHAVETELAVDQGALADDIQVGSVDGIVALTGTVPHRVASVRASASAASIRGVRAVDNRILVMPPARADETIRADILHALLLDERAPTGVIEVDVEDQVVRLRGHVETWKQARITRHIAGAITGVREVNDGIRVRPRPRRSDDELRRRIALRLRHDSLVEASLVGVHVHRGRVSLRGQVGSAAERRRAQTAAGVEGVRSVNIDDLAVSWWLDDRQLHERLPGALRPDQLERAVRRALAADLQANARDVDVTVRGQTVTLRGHVPTIRDEYASIRVARQTAGVAAVHSELEHRPSRHLPAPAIEDRLRWALGAHASTASAADEVGVEVEHQWVRLQGSVDSHLVRAELEDIALGLPEVTGVTNDVRVLEPRPVFYPELYPDPYYPVVRPAAPPGPDASVSAGPNGDLHLRRSVVEQLVWSAFADATTSEVNVEDGVVTLLGIVATRRAQDAATSNAYEAGATSVVNRLSVDPTALRPRG